MWSLIKKIWAAMRRPSVHFSLGFLTLGGFLCGILFWGGFNTALEMTNTQEFCTGCHEMRDNVYADLQATVHFTNASGVRAKCSDCHVPHEWTNKIARKIAASKEVYGWLFGTIDTREEFEEHRLAMAQREWARFEANDSLECRNCHSEEAMDFSQQSPRAVDAHERLLGTGEATCIDCHKGIAHTLPEMPPETAMLHGLPATGGSADANAIYGYIGSIALHRD